MSKHSIQDIIKMADQIFLDYDKDKTGDLEKEEAKQFLMDMFKTEGMEISGKGAEYAVNAIDANNDGKISKMELVKYVIDASDN